jgi:hypothetical protein
MLVAPRNGADAAQNNPFRPNGIVTNGMFCVDWEEMKSVE